MPHFIIEHSADLADPSELKKLGELVRDVAVETGVFPLGGIRVRFHPCETYVIADGHEDNKFISIIVRIGAGRTLEAKQMAGQKIYDAVSSFFEAELAGEHFMISLDINEINADVSFKKSTIHGRLNKNVN